MASGVFNVSRGAIGYLADPARGLSGANSRVVIVVLQVAEVDDTLNNHDTLAAVLAGSNTEAVSTNYARIQLAAAALTWTVDDTGNDAQIIIDSDQVWTSVSQAGSESWVKLLVCYDADNTSGTDANIIPLTYHDFSVTPSGVNITADFDQTAGFCGWT